MLNNYIKSIHMSIAYVNHYLRNLSKTIYGLKHCVQANQSQQ